MPAYDLAAHLGRPGHGCFLKVSCLQLLIWLPTGLMNLRERDLEPESQDWEHCDQELHCVSWQGDEDWLLPGDRQKITFLEDQMWFSNAAVMNMLSIMSLLHHNEPTYGGVS